MAAALAVEDLVLRVELVPAAVGLELVVRLPPNAGADLFIAQVRE